MSKVIKINGAVEIPDELSADEFFDKFIEFIEQNGCYFGGGTDELQE